MAAAPRHAENRVFAHLSCKQCSLPTLNISSPSCVSDGAEISMLDNLQAEGGKSGSPPEQVLPSRTPFASVKIHSCL